MTKTKRNNKGFTLVELIVVIAILGVLAAVLVPQYIQYVEKSRLAVDKAAINEIRHAVEISAAEEDIYNAISAGDATLTLTVKADGSATITSNKTQLQSAVLAVVPSVTFKSNNYKKAGELVFKISESGKCDEGIFTEKP